MGFESGKCMRENWDQGCSVSVTPDGKRAVSGSWGKLYEFGFETGLRLIEHIAKTARVNCVSITPDGKRAVSGRGDRLLRVWDFESGECLKNLIGHTDSVECVTITLDGRKAASGSWD